MKHTNQDTYSRAEVLHRVAWGDAYGYEPEEVEFTRPILRERWQWDNRTI